ncbi:serine hydrolase-like protein [Pieris rapae]|uniref:serine hydrolase-like protein n=1 Tax=Pieris rapae TaxID=64459 RepID=UPI001E27FBEC|nr:serine hydrolase-like protein [Pieris rapae]
MAKIMTKVILNNKGKFTEPLFVLLGKSQCNGLHSKVSVKEIKIPIPGGHIAGKLWGNDQQQPILALHGWQDNCGVWDPLAPMLCDKKPILAIDLPGHGFSSWIAPGALQDTWDVVQYIIELKNYFKWDKFSILGHSLGSVAGLRYAGLYPKNVDFFIAIENLVYEDHDIDHFLKYLPKALEKSQMSQHALNNEPPESTMEELTYKLYIAMNKSVDKQNMHYLTQRAIRPSKRDLSKFCYTRDIRLKYLSMKPPNIKFLETLFSRLSFPLLYIKAANSSYKLSDEHCLRVREILENNNPYYESHTVGGSHHVHINNPERLAPIIVDFFRKHKIIQE